jgi:hypothetical protein
VPAHFLPGDMQLQRISLATGIVEVIRSESGATPQIFGSPQFSPISDDVVLQRGGNWGHVQSASYLNRGRGHLVLYNGLLH